LLEEGNGVAAVSDEAARFREFCSCAFLPIDVKTVELLLCAVVGWIGCTQTHQFHSKHIKHNNKKAKATHQRSCGRGRFERQLRRSGNVVRAQGGSRSHRGRRQYALLPGGCGAGRLWLRGGRRQVGHGHLLRPRRALLARLLRLSRLQRRLLAEGGRRELGKLRRQRLARL